MMRFDRANRVAVVHPYAWAWEPLEREPSFVLRTMFGAKAAYVGGRMVLCFCGGEEPWRGVLVCTDRTHHVSLVEEFPNLSPHPVLPKWLYLPESVMRFEATAARLVELVRRRDPRVGIEPGTRKRKKKAAPKGVRHRPK